MSNTCTDVYCLIFVHDQVAALLDARSRGGGRIDIIVDNAGFELFCDLCLADYVVVCGAAKQVVRSKQTLCCEGSIVLSANYWSFPDSH